MSERTPERTPERTQERTPYCTPERTPERSKIDYVTKCGHLAILTMSQNVDSVDVTILDHLGKILRRTTTTTTPPTTTTTLTK